MSEAILFGAPPSSSTQHEESRPLRTGFAAGTTFGGFPASADRFREGDYGDDDLAYLSVFQFLSPGIAFGVTDRASWAAAASLGLSSAGIDWTIRRGSVALTFQADTFYQWQSILQYRRPTTSTRRGWGAGVYYRKEEKGITFGCAPERICLDVGQIHEYAILRSFGTRFVMSPAKRTDFPLELHAQVGYAHEFRGPVASFGLVLTHHP